MVVGSDSHLPGKLRGTLRRLLSDEDRDVFTAYDDKAASYMMKSRVGDEFIEMPTTAA